MPLPFVVVDVGPPPVRVELAATLIQACSSAVPQGHCELAGRSKPSRPPRAAVRVSWQQPQQRQARISISWPARPGEAPVVRALQFRDADAPTERWRAVGFAIGAMVGEEEQRSAASSQGTEPGEGEGIDGAADRAPPLWLGLGAQTGPGLDGGTWRFGGWLRADYTFAQAPLLVGLAASYSASPEDERRLDASWLAVGAGAGVWMHWPTARMELRLRGEVFAERLAVWTRDELSGLEDSGSRWAVGPRVSAHVTWPHDSVVAGVIGLSAWTLSDETTIRLRGQEVASAPWAGLSLQLGVRLGLP